MSKAPAFQFYPNDWLSSTNIMLMTPAEEGAYIRLLAISWNNDDCSLPNDDEQLAVLSRLGEGWFNGSSTKIRKCFKAKGNRLVNERLQAERKKQDEWREKSRQGGIKSGKARNNTDLTDEGCLKGGSTKGEPKGNSSSSSSSSSKDLNTLVISGANNGCPHQKIIDLYHNILTMLPRVRMWTPKRAKMLKARWSSSTEYQDLEWWEQFFIFIREDCPHLIGKNDRQWTADLEWLVKEENFAKTVEGRYRK